MSSRAFLPLSRLFFFEICCSLFQYCVREASISQSKVSLTIVAFCLVTCGHNRAWRYYAESVENPYGFPASRCPKWRSGIQANCAWKPEAYMGFAADSKYRGKFYLSTNSRSPFARNLTGHRIGK